MRLLWIFISIATNAICVYPALQLKPNRRLVTLLVLAISVALLPLFVPWEAKIAHFCVALMAAITVFKMWDLHVGVAKGSRPDFRTFLGIVANLYFLVFRKHGVELQATKLSSLKDLALGTAGLAAVLGGLTREIGRAARHYSSPGHYRGAKGQGAQRAPPPRRSVNPVHRLLRFHAGRRDHSAEASGAGTGRNFSRLR